PGGGGRPRARGPGTARRAPGGGRRRHACARREATEAAIEALGPTFERRRREGRVVEGHGDLHLQHVWLPRDVAAQDDPPIIDCLEFSESLRVIDVAAEVAFLAMDLAYRGAGALAEAFLRDYVLETDDYDLYSVLDLYVSHRAAVRGKVAALAAADAEIDAEQRAGAAESAQRHVELALRALEPRPPGTVVLVGGVIGTGKSTVARALADRMGAVVVSSDRVRKARLGLGATERLSTGVDAGAYSPEARAEVYDAMLERAAPVVASGRTVVLDATWSERAMRERARAWAGEHRARCVFVETRCDVDVLRDRLTARKARGDDPSDAGPELLDASLQRFEALDDADPWPAAERSHVDTDRDDGGDQIAALLRALDLPAGSIWG
ncbi:MAG: AAA family ATPase, partial [Actinomycetota bacterium]|nr:AAA family ATPase [Actinomycetota bacterium]